MSRIERYRSDQGHGDLSSKMHLRAVSAALSVALLAWLLATPSAQAQTYKVLYSFTQAKRRAIPEGILVLDSAGNLYGVTNEGGAFNGGTVFRVDKTDKETVLYSFTGSPDGSGPGGSLVRDAAGSLYGITGTGGTSGYGTVFKLDTIIGTETVLHSFPGGAVAGFPHGLIRDLAGNLYGTTGTGGGSHGIGTVFRLTP